MMTPDEIAGIAAHILLDVEFYGHACKERAEGSKIDCARPLHFVKVGVDRLTGEAVRFAGAEYELARLRAENERLKADAARFQWVLAQMRFENERDMGPGRHWRFAFYLPRQDPREDPAAAVDAAMAQGKV